MDTNQGAPLDMQEVGNQHPTLFGSFAPADPSANQTISPPAASTPANPIESRAEASERSLFAELPLELVGEIEKHLEVQDKVNLRLTCLKFYGDAALPVKQWMHEQLASMGFGVCRCHRHPYCRFLHREVRGLRCNMVHRMGGVCVNCGISTDTGFQRHYPDPEWWGA